MSLVDALLLDPVRLNVWVSATRTDGNRGPGTQTDPFDGSTAAKLDAVLDGLPNEKRVAARPNEGCQAFQRLEEG